jgi:hypothetical protein
VSGYLARLVSRSRGESPEARPRVPTRFEDAPWFEPEEDLADTVADEAAAAPPAAGLAAADPVHRVSNLPPATERPRRDRPPVEPKPTEPGRRAAASESDPAPAADKLPIPGTVPWVVPPPLAMEAPPSSVDASFAATDAAPREPRPVADGRETLIRLAPEALPSSPPSSTPAPPTEPPTPTVPTLAVRDVAPIAVDAAPAGGDSPVIEVRIGRIDVQTAPASLPPRRQVRARREPQVDLADYLRRRREG